MAFDDLRAQIAEWLREPVRLAFACIALAFLGFANVTWTTVQLLRAEQMVDHTRDIRAASGELLQAFTDTETGQRGYILTGDPQFLKSFEVARGRIDDTFRHLKDLTQDNPTQQRLISEAESIGDAKFDRLDAAILLMRSGRKEAAAETVKSGGGLQLMDDLRNRVTAIQAEEDRLLVGRRATAERLGTWLIASTSVALAIAAIAVWFFWQFFNNEQQRLASIVKERTHQLETEKERMTLLLDDFHHRIGNSLSMVGAILGHHAATTKSREVKDIMNSARHRLQAIGAAQRRLHFSTGQDAVDAKDYLERTLGDISSLIETSRIAVSFKADPVVLPSREASSLAIIMSELVINAAKHAFPEPMQGKVAVRLQHQADGFAFEVEDDGTGIAEPTPDSTGIGTRIIEGLLRSLGGHMETKLGEGPPDRPGTLHVITFRSRPERSDPQQQEQRLSA